MHADAAYTRKTTQAMEDQAWAGVQANKGDSNFLRRWFGHYLGMASSKGALDRLAAILDGKLVVENLAVSQDLRWSIIGRLNRFAYPGSAELVTAELARDKSDSGQSAALAATVVRPDPKTKAEWLAKVEDLKTTLPFSKVRIAMGSLYPVEQARAQRSERRRAAGQAAGDGQGRRPGLHAQLRRADSGQLHAGQRQAARSGGGAVQGPVGRHPPRAARHAPGRQALPDDPARR